MLAPYQSRNVHVGRSDVWIADWQQSVTTKRLLPAGAVLERPGQPGHTAQDVCPGTPHRREPCVPRGRNAS